MKSPRWGSPKLHKLRKINMLKNNTKYLSIPQVAEHLGIGVETVRKLIRDGDIPIIRWGYRTLRIDSSKLDEVIAALTIGGPSKCGRNAKK